MSSDVHPNLPEYNLHCCSKCKGLFRLAEEKARHQLTCTANPYKAPCTHFACERKIFLQLFQPEDFEVEGSFHPLNMSKDDSFINPFVKIRMPDAFDPSIFFRTTSTTPPNVTDQAETSYLLDENMKTLDTEAPKDPCDSFIEDKKSMDSMNKQQIQNIINKNIEYLKETELPNVTDSVVDKPGHFPSSQSESRLLSPIDKHLNFLGDMSKSRGQSPFEKCVGYLNDHQFGYQTNAFGYSAPPQASFTCNLGTDLLGGFTTSTEDNQHPLLTNIEECRTLQYLDLAKKDPFFGQSQILPQVNSKDPFLINASVKNDKMAVGVSSVKVNMARSYEDIPSQASPSFQLQDANYFAFPSTLDEPTQLDYLDLATLDFLTNPNFSYSSTVFKEKTWKDDDIYSENNLVYHEQSNEQTLETIPQPEKLNRSRQVNDEQAQFGKRKVKNLRLKKSKSDLGNPNKVCLLSGPSSGHRTGTDPQQGSYQKSEVHTSRPKKPSRKRKMSETRFDRHKLMPKESFGYAGKRLCKSSKTLNVSQPITGFTDEEKESMKAAIRREDCIFVKKQIGENKKPVVVVEDLPESIVKNLYRTEDDIQTDHHTYRNAPHVEVSEMTNDTCKEKKLTSVLKLKCQICNLSCPSVVELKNHSLTHKSETEVATENITENSDIFQSEAAKANNPKVSPTKDELIQLTGSVFENISVSAVSVVGTYDTACGNLTALPQGDLSAVQQANSNEVVTVFTIKESDNDNSILLCDNTIDDKRSGNQSDLVTSETDSIFNQLDLSTPITDIDTGQLESNGMDSENPGKCQVVSGTTLVDLASSNSSYGISTTIDERMLPNAVTIPVMNPESDDIVEIALIECDKPSEQNNAEVDTKQLEGLENSALNEPNANASAQFDTFYLGQSLSETLAEDSDDYEIDVVNVDPVDIELDKEVETVVACGNKTNGSRFNTKLKSKQLVTNRRSGLNERNVTTVHNELDENNVTTIHDGVEVFQVTGSAVLTDLNQRDLTYSGQTGIKDKQRQISVKEGLSENPSTIYPSVLSAKLTRQLEENNDSQPASESSSEIIDVVTCTSEVEFDYDENSEVAAINEDKGNVSSAFTVPITTIDNTVPNGRTVYEVRNNGTVYEAGSDVNCAFLIQTSVSEENGISQYDVPSNISISEGNRNNSPVNICHGVITNTSVAPMKISELERSDASLLPMNTYESMSMETLNQAEDNSNIEMLTEVKPIEIVTEPLEEAIEPTETLTELTDIQSIETADETLNTTVEMATKSNEMGSKSVETVIKNREGVRVGKVICLSVKKADGTRTMINDINKLVKDKSLPLNDANKVVNGEQAYGTESDPRLNKLTAVTCINTDTFNETSKGTKDINSITDKVRMEVDNVNATKVKPGSRFDEFSDVPESRFDQFSTEPESRFNQLSTVSESRFDQFSTVSESRFNQLSTVSESRFNQLSTVSKSRSDESSTVPESPIGKAAAVTYNGGTVVTRPIMTRVLSVSSTSSTQSVTSEAKVMKDLTEQTLNKAGEVYKCDQCEFTSLKRHSVTAHKAKHQGIVYYCPEPGCTFNSIYQKNLKQHQRLKHTDCVKYACTECSYTTNQKRLLTRHIQSNHLKKKRFKCTDCEYMSMFRSDVVQHFRTAHLNQKLFSCNQCEYKTSHTSRLRFHLMAHAGIRPYKCSACDYRVADGSKVTRHIRLKHAGDNKVVCEKLDVEFEIVAKDFQCETKVSEKEIDVIVLSNTEEDEQMLNPESLNNEKQQLDNKQVKNTKQVKNSKQMENSKQVKNSKKGISNKQVISSKQGISGKQGENSKQVISRKQVENAKQVIDSKQVIKTKQVISTEKKALGNQKEILSNVEKRLMKTMHVVSLQKVLRVTEKGQIAKRQMLSNQEQKLCNQEQQLSNQVPKLSNQEQLNDKGKTSSNQEQMLSNQEEKLSNQGEKLSNHVKYLGSSQMLSKGKLIHPTTRQAISIDINKQMGQKQLLTNEDNEQTVNSQLLNSDINKQMGQKQLLTNERMESDQLLLSEDGEPIGQKQLLASENIQPMGQKQLPSRDNNEVIVNEEEVNTDDNEELADGQIDGEQVIWRMPMISVVTS